MNWQQVRERYPNQWLVIEALVAHTEGQQRCLDQIAVVDTCSDGGSALQQYRQLHLTYPQREFYYVHTAREKLDIRERQWLGLRGAYAAYITGWNGLWLAHQRHFGARFLVESWRYH